jgi:PAS domain S-box-containing protein
MKERIVKMMVVVFGVILLVLVSMAVISILTIRKSQATTDWLYHTSNFMLGMKGAETRMNAGEVSVRNYIATTNSKDQESYRYHFNEALNRHLPMASRLSEHEPALHDRVQAIGNLISNRIFTVDRDVAKALQQQNVAAAIRVLQNDAGSEQITRIYWEISSLLNDQCVDLLERVHAANMAARNMRWTIWVGLTFNFLLVVVLGWLIVDDLAARRRAMTALEEANALLEQKVRERTADLVKANEDLKKENLARQWSEQSLAHQLHYSDLIISSISDHIFVVSKANNISRVNSTVIHTSGYGLQEIVGSRVDKLLAIQDPADPTQLRFSQALKEGRELQNRQATLLCKGGARLAAQFNMIPLRDQNKVVGGVLTLRLNPAGDPKQG